MKSNANSLEGADRYLFLGLLLLLFWLPLPLASNHLWAWSFFEVCVFVLAIYWLVLFAMGRVSTTLAFRRAWPALLLFAMVFVWTIFQLAPLPPSLIALLSPNGAEVYSHTQTDATLSLDPSSTRAAALKTLAYGVLFAMTLLLVNQKIRLRYLALVLVFSGVFQAAFGALMTLSGLEYGFFISKGYNTGAVTGTFVNPNHLAGYLEMCLALGVGVMLADISTIPTLSWRESARRLLNTILGNKVLVRIALIIMVIGLVLSKSRMGNIAFFSSLLVAGGYYVLVARRVSVVIIAFFVSVLLIDILIIGNIFGIEKVAEEIRQTSVATEASRIDIGNDALEIVRDYPLTGTGAGSFASTYPMYDNGKVGSWHYKHAHNDYLEFACEFGLPGLTMLAGIVLLSLWHAALSQLKHHNQMMRGLGCGVIMAIVALLIHSAVDFNLQIPANAATFVVILAMGWHTRWLPHDDKRHCQKSRVHSRSKSILTE
jgi:putative inorganic carbon (HCO3(-)) transporter